MLERQLTQISNEDECIESISESLRCQYTEDGGHYNVKYTHGRTDYVEFFTLFYMF